MRRFASLLFLAPTVALAQTVPDAGLLLQQIGPAPQLSAPKPPPTRLEETRKVPSAEGARIAVEAFRISGAGSIPAAELQALIADGTGRELTLAELDELALRITRHYRAAGFMVARAYVPTQEIENGVVEIAVLEGVLDAVRVDNPAGLGGAALAPLGALRTGAPLRTEALEASLLALADLPGVEVRSTLRPGETIGASELLVDVRPGRALQGSVDADNSGNRFTGAHRLGASVYWNNPVGVGDQASVRAQVSEEKMTYVRVGYQLPAGPNGTRIGAAWSVMRYGLGKDFAALGADGSATTASLYLQHPLLRRRDANLFVSLQYDDKNLDDRIGSTGTRSDRTLDTLTASLQGSLADGLGGGGVSSIALSWTTGRLDMDAASVALDEASARSKGRFDRWSLAMNRTQRLTDSWSLLLSWTEQGALENLNSSEKFSLGGVQGVRAYPQGEAAGDEGRLLSAELRWTLSEAWQAQVFYDHGRVRINRDPWLAAENRRHLAGAGFGVMYARNNVSFRILAAWKAGTGKPTSDTDRSPRVWAQVARFF